MNSAINKLGRLIATKKQITRQMETSVKRIQEINHQDATIFTRPIREESR